MWILRCELGKESCGYKSELMHGARPKRETQFLKRRLDFVRANGSHRCSKKTTFVSPAWSQTDSSLNFPSSVASSVQRAHSLFLQAAVRIERQCAQNALCQPPESGCSYRAKAGTAQPYARPQSLARILPYFPHVLSSIQALAISSFPALEV